jgi:phytoene synthase
MQASKYCADIVRAHDRDRYLATLFASDATRPHLFALYAFSSEVARVRESVSEPGLGEIRLQWWRDAIASIYQGHVPDHPVTESLAAAIAHGSLPQRALQNLIDARVFDLYDDPMPTLNDLDGYLGETSSVLIQLATLILAGSDAQDAAEASGHAGIAYGVTGLMRAVPVHRARGQCFLPKELLAANDTSPAHILSGRWGEGERKTFVALCAHARAHLERAKVEQANIPPAALPGFLAVGLVDGFLKELQKPNFNPLDTIADVSQLRRQWRILRCVITKRF